MHARQRAFRKVGIVSRHPAVIGVAQKLADPFAHTRVVALLGHQNDSGHEAVKPVHAGQDAHAGALAGMNDLGRKARQLVRINLEQFVARIGFEHVQKRLARMRGRVERQPLQNAARLRVEIGDRQDRLRIGRGGEQADDAQLPLGPLWSEPLEADIIEIGPPVHDRLRVGLCDDQRVVARQKRLDMRRGLVRSVRRGIAPQHAEFGVGQNAEALRVLAR